MFKLHQREKVNQSSFLLIKMSNFKSLNVFMDKRIIWYYLKFSVKNKRSNKAMPFVVYMMILKLLFKWDYQEIQRLNSERIKKLATVIKNVQIIIINISSQFKNINLC